MKCHHDSTTSRNLRQHLTAVHGEDLLGTVGDVVSAEFDGFAADVFLLAGEAGCVALEGFAVCAVAGGRGVDCDGWVSFVDRGLGVHGGGGDILPRALPMPPMLPVAATMAPWPATSWVRAKRPKAMAEVENCMLIGEGCW